MARKPKTNFQRALNSLVRLSLSSVEVVSDVVTLLEQIHKLEHHQDRTLILAIAKRYAFKPYEMPHVD